MWWWNISIHSSWRIALACAGFVAGVAASIAVSVPWVAGLVSGAVLIGLLCVGRRYALLGIAGASLVCGQGYGSAWLAQRSRFDEFIGEMVQVEGRIKEDPSRSASGAISLQLDKVSVQGVSLPGVVFVSVRSVREVKRGDIVTAAGIAKKGFAQFPIMISVTRLNAVARSPTADMGRVVRDWFADAVRTQIKEPQASLGIGFLTGQKSALPPDLAESLKIAGLTHIVVASGYNLTILVRMARKVFLRTSKFLSFISSGGMILAFMTITGLSPSMTRAGLVSGMSLLSWYYGHTFHPFVLLPVAAALTVAFQPTYVWGDLGWQLSFSAFLGVMVVGPLLQRYFFGEKEPGTFRQILGETIAAHIVTVPIIALSFGVVSNVAIIANILVVPLVPLAMLLTFLCGVGALLALPFVTYLATVTSWLLEYMVSVATFVSEIPWAQSQLAVHPLLWVAYAWLVGVGCVWMWRKTNYRFGGGEQLL